MNNIATDGYGLHTTNRPNIPTSGYGNGLDIGALLGSVLGDTDTLTVVEFDAATFALLEAGFASEEVLAESVQVTELVGIPLAQAIMVGVGQTVNVLGSDVAVEALDAVDSALHVLSGDDASAETVGSDAASTVVDSVTGTGTDMMGTDDTETGVA